MEDIISTNQQCVIVGSGQQLGIDQHIVIHFWDSGRSFQPAFVIGHEVFCTH